MFILIYTYTYIYFQVYKHLENSFLSSSYGRNRPNWWEEIINGSNLKNKLWFVLTKDYMFKNFILDNIFYGEMFSISVVF